MFGHRIVQVEGNVRFCEHGFAFSESQNRTLAKLSRWAKRACLKLGYPMPKLEIRLIISGYHFFSNSWTRSFNVSTVSFGRTGHFF